MQPSESIEVTAHIENELSPAHEDTDRLSPRDSSVSGKGEQPRPPRTVFRQIVGNPFQCEWDAGPGEPRYVEPAEDEFEDHGAKRFFTQVQFLVLKRSPDLKHLMRIRPRIEETQHGIGRRCVVLVLDAAPDSESAQLVRYVINALKVEMERVDATAPKLEGGASPESRGDYGASGGGAPALVLQQPAGQAGHGEDVPCEIEGAMNSRIVVQSAEPVACEDHATEMRLHDQAASRVAEPQPDPLAHLADFAPEIQAQVKKKASALASMLSGDRGEVIRIDDGKNNTLFELNVPAKQPVEPIDEPLPEAQYQFLAMDRHGRTIKLETTTKPAKKLKVAFEAAKFLEPLEHAFLRLKDLGGGRFERDHSAAERAGFPLINAVLEEVRNGNKIERYKLARFDVVRTPAPQPGAVSSTR
ncbi:MAG: hypothetical protein KF871_01995 [Hydrogenophaga sp.]|uniref:hypothetical protein n=1 Tax=Hydrogenophaga sp. TaxID=1904254 RepID=UPI001D960CF6|nr:hypothetical protein [Hydrogenophaga sp.]MBX3608641.1 hypothetical protein [Hydrogenophaga sp.]